MWNWNECWSAPSRFLVFTFNRTNVELKRIWKIERSGWADTFNRTNVDLKQKMDTPATFYQNSFNRTNVELKLITKHNAKRIIAFNRTNVELKLSFHGSLGTGWWRLLIEPMWNWNGFKRQYQGWHPKLLIEPMWNWNPQTTHTHSAQSAFF